MELPPEENDVNDARKSENPLPLDFLSDLSDLSSGESDTWEPSDPQDLGGDASDSETCCSDSSSSDDSIEDIDESKPSPVLISDDDQTEVGEPTNLTLPREKLRSQWAALLRRRPADDDEAGLRRWMESVIKSSGAHRIRTLRSSASRAAIAASLGR